MDVLKTIAWVFVTIYCIIIILLYTFQTKLIFYPGVLDRDFRFKLGPKGEEIFLTTVDGEQINGLFFGNDSSDVILYFHGNAGDLSGWQFVAEDFTDLGYNFIIIDYRGYGKSSGKLSEKGLYMDADAAFHFLIEKGFSPDNILIYGRSIGAGIAVDLGSRKKCKGLILEAPFTSFSRLANEKFPVFFPSLYLKFRFDNFEKINSVKCPVIFLHGSNDSLIPSSHSEKLFEHFTGKKKMIIVDRGSHNDLNAFRQYEEFLKDVMPSFFE
ncbi:MAG: alpha/beta hydrolase [Cyclobacteriaceae bacterium]